MAGNIGFAIEMDVSTRGESFHIRGDQHRLVVRFSSLRAAVRAFRSFPTRWFERHSRIRSTLLEIEISGFKIAVTGQEITPDLMARLLGLRSTRFDLWNLLRTAVF